VTDNVAVVLCQRLDEPGYPVNGSTIERCRCGQEVWVAASTYDRAPICTRFDFVCGRCVSREEMAVMLDQFELPKNLTLSMIKELVQHHQDHPGQWPA
jgi:hypothetical protein